MVPDEAGIDAATASNDLARQRERLAAIDGRAAAELEAAWANLCALVDEQAAACKPDASASEATDLDALRNAGALARERCLLRPLDILARHGPDRRALGAVDMHGRMVDGWLRLLPDTLPLSGKGAVADTAMWGTRTRWSWIARWRRRPRPVPLAAIAEATAARLDQERAQRDGECLAAFAAVMRQLSRQWHSTRLGVDALVDRRLEPGEAEQAAADTQGELARIRADGERALAQRRDWLAQRWLPAFGAALVRATVRRWPGRTRPRERRDRDAHWRRQFDLVRAEIELVDALEAAQAALLDGLEQQLRRALDEDEALAAELERLLGALRREPATPPATAVAATPANARVARIDRIAQAQTAELPESRTVGVRLRPLPVGRDGGRQVQPAREFGEDYRRAIKPSLLGLFQAIEADQREVVEELQRACDVVAFAGRAAETGAGSAILDEAVENAAALLEFRRAAPPKRQADGMRAAAALCRASRDTRIALFGGVLERATNETRRELERGLPSAAALLVRTLVRAASSAGRALRGGSRRSLARIGWLRDQSAGVVPVAIRPALPREFAGNVLDPNLPALYRHLFRPEPVEDPRFLVGRGAELAAIADARARWEAGRSAGVLVVGERGSGKTSLINCALLGPLEGLHVDRGEFGDRAMDAEAMRRVIAKAVGAPDAAQLESYLAKGRRVVVLEELERTFIRQIGGYEAVHALGRLINTTSSTVLWVVVVNEVAFHFLQAVIGMGQRFSHRLHAGTADADEIRRAILVRHDLSGLRLRFEPPPTERGITKHVRTALRRGVDAERLFFERIASQSAGVYRTAFNLWLAHIGEIRDGLCTVKPAAATDLSPIIADLTLDDLFTLLAMLQHGSLTAAEHSTVFRLPIESSRAQIDELVAREIIAEDPGRPGYRVRPEAMRVAQEALYRRNLL